ncbi:Apoptosis-enhancing nuclease [Wickerhamomyces ciferrii]|uniref:Apoptosis-enhancing nuclease n=1 Tax=Wickerhamomyces ciferrii (strain ATCC 14091 / BCRC 22168 / CBS 111 / JCM 3599 / NBRC 0793 / NRRL Y-1031 F-60-10) TaxID=1206466 RepID=K0KUY7_WICCF|nr:Apoptosis-enhancing nuclease [Wickerhamomyces ciferrii]CCH44973.1 Apoptosis-enhancing nuclease [Wickerhamomyces ciferrii]
MTVDFDHYAIAEKLILTYDQLSRRSYPVHSKVPGFEGNPKILGSICLDLSIDGEFVETFRSFCTREPKIFALDCEMIQTSYLTKSVGKVAVVDINGKRILEEILFPNDPMYYMSKKTRYYEENFTVKSFKKLQNKLCNIIGVNDILVGHALQGDLRALKLRHPKIVDTRTLYEDVSSPKSLKSLAVVYLGENIQRSKRKHDPVEDFRASMSLFKKFCVKSKAKVIKDQEHPSSIS